MTEDEVLEEFRASNALLEGHFILSSGRHSRTYLEKALVFAQPERAERLARALADKIRTALGEPVTRVISPALGAIVPGYETARQLGLPSFYAERVEGHFTFRRGFTLKTNEAVVMVEDIVTTGLSSRECLEAIRSHGGRPVLAACFIDRSGGRVDLGVPLVSLARLDIPTYGSCDLPPDLRAIPPVKPGSRGLNSHG
jgi:orotate phosphoribosyltransferase